eukprot:CAMPEP_0184746974 /NCGR_PEP_ID=MMETSP0315-20130426/9417_1 /TAXON_ID=101924 /ORGANISM="Rhodosorus marinus, Strain UTEX LB 2760" /LENGTH=501 /DNA_ID=CAMNT_0027219725 /DNA_START=131 /DNA_END=1636 /DNA_ORIENTATION=-
MNGSGETGYGSNSGGDHEGPGVYQRKNSLIHDVLGESKAQLQLMLPTALVYASSVLLWLTSFAVLGRLGEKQLAGASLGMTLSNLFGNVVTLGLSSALDIHLTQAHGARQIRSMQAALQRGMLVLTIACGFVSIILFNGEKILLLARQDPELAKIGGTIMKWTCIAIWPMTMFDIVKRYFQAMSRLRPALVTTLFALVVTVLSNFILVFVKGYGVNGVGASLFLGNLSMFLTIFAYYCYSEVPDSWWQLSDEAFERWQNFLSLAFPSLVMMFFEWGSFEVGLLVISYLGPETIATQTILMNAAYLLFTIPAGVSTAAVTRVGNHLGSGDGRAASIASNVCGVLAGLTGIFAAALLTFTRNYWPYIYTNDESLLAAVIEVSPWLAIFELTDNIQTTLGAAVKGTGRPHLGAILTAVGFWVISVPLGSYIAITQETVAGIWQGFLYGEIVLISSYVYTLYSTDWQLMVEKAQRLVLSDAEIRSPLLKRAGSIPPSPIPETIFV